MDSKNPIIIELEKTPNGCVVTQIIGVKPKPQPVPEPQETIMIHIPLQGKSSPTKLDMSANLIKKEATPPHIHQNYEVYPHAQITPNMNQTMTPMEIKKEEKKESSPAAPDDKNSGGISQQLTFSEIKKYPMVFPSCARWFDINNIHEIEQQAMPEYFCGRSPCKTPQIYMEYRNYIIKLYRSNPHGYLSATTCRRHLADRKSVV